MAVRRVERRAFQHHAPAARLGSKPGWRRSATESARASRGDREDESREKDRRQHRDERAHLKRHRLALTQLETRSPIPERADQVDEEVAAKRSRYEPSNLDVEDTRGDRMTRSWPGK